MKRPEGSDWELGCGGFGKVFKALRNGAQPVAVKVLTVRGGAGRAGGLWGSGKGRRCSAGRDTGTARQLPPSSISPSCLPSLTCLPPTCHAHPQSGPETRYMALNEFRREVAILKACRDPNIVAFLVSS